MEKQKNKLALILCLGLLAGMTLAGSIQAAGSVTVSWTPPTTDEGGATPMTGLTGYKIYRSSSAINCTAWNAGDQSYRAANPLSATVINVSGGSLSKYRFKYADGLVAGQTYHFAVAATDGTNLSKCATDTNGATEVSKVITYAGDIYTGAGSLNKVDGQDLNLLKTYFGTTNTAGDVDGDGGTVDMADVNLMKFDFQNSF